MPEMPVPMKFVIEKLYVAAAVGRMTSPLPFCNRYVIHLGVLTGDLEDGCIATLPNLRALQGRAPFRLDLPMWTGRRA